MTYIVAPFIKSLFPFSSSLVMSGMPNQGCVLCITVGFAAINVDKYFSMAIDGIDTTKTELPFSKSRHGTSVKAWHLRVHIVGALVHGRDLICFLDHHQFPHDSNLLMNTLLQVSHIHTQPLNLSYFSAVQQLQLDDKQFKSK